MKILIVLLGIAAVAFAGTVRVVDPEPPSVLGFLKNVAVPAAEARKLAEKRHTQTKITGGSLAEKGQYPWQAALIIDVVGFEGNGLGGAVLVSHNRLLTAAHCWADGVNQAWRFTVVLGSLTLFTGNDGVRQQTGVVVTHPDWTPLLIQNDIAVIYLLQSITPSDTISPVSLPSREELSISFAGFTAYASGFGATSDGAPIPADQPLSQVPLEVMTNSVCWWSFPFIVQDSNICTSGEEGRSPCPGDSGGPLVTVNDNRTVLIGLTSFGSGQGCQAGHPAVFARVTSFMDFIEKHLE